MLRCHDLTLAVPGRVLCRGVSFAVEPGEVWAVLGPNGSGKTTLLHALADLNGRASDAVTLDGAAVSDGTNRTRARQIGLLLQQEDADFWGSVFEYVLLGRFPHARSWLGWQQADRAAARAALELVSLGALAEQRFATLSGGERQRARIAQLLAQAPRLLLLDEPLQHLDLRHQALVLALFRELATKEARAVVMVLHDALWAGCCCTHALLLHDGGNFLAGSAQQVLTRSNLEHLYGCALDEVIHEEGRYFVPRV